MSNLQSSGYFSKYPFKSSTKFSESQIAYKLYLVQSKIKITLAKYRNAIFNKVIEYSKLSGVV